MTLLALQGLNAVVYSSLLVLMVLGLSLIFGLGGVVNFAHAALFAIGAYVGLTVAGATGSFWSALLVAPVVVGLVGYVVERSVIRRIRQRPELETLLMTFGIGMALLGGIVLVWGANPRTIRPPVQLQGRIEILGATLPTYRLFVVVIGLLLTSLLLYVIYRTSAGLRLRAINDDPVTAQAMGINGNAILTVVFATGAALAASAGVLSAPILTLSPGMGDPLMIEAFIAVIVGGAGNLKGGILAAVVVGFARTFAGAYAPEYGTVILLGVIAVILLLRPNGLLAKGRLA